MALQDTDLLLVQRGTQSYKLTGANAKSFIGGDLQAVTDRGNTTTNGATFGGNVTSTAGRFTSQRTDGGDGAYRTELSGDLTHIVFANGDVKIGSDVTDAATTNIELNADGQIKASSSKVVTEFTRLVAASSSNTHSILKSAADGNTTIGQIQCDGTYHIGGDESTSNITLNADGSGSFAGSVQSKSWPTTGYQLEGSGGLGLTAAAGTTGNMIALKVDGTSVASITGQGEAEFSGDVTVGEILTGSSDKSGVRTYEAGYLAVQKEAGDNTHLWLGYQGNAVKSQINADGSASFSGGNCEVSSDGLLRVKRSAANGSAGLVVYPDNNFSVAAVAAINTDGSANFANRVFTADLVAGSTDYTGPYFFAGPTEIALNTNQSTPVFKVKDDGSAVFDARVSGSVSTIPNNSAFALTDSNFWTAAGGTWVNPTEATPGQSGVIYVQTEVNAFGNFWSFPGGVTPTIPANSVVPYYVESSNKIRLGLATEAFV